MLPGVIHGALQNLYLKRYEDFLPSIMTVWVRVRSNRKLSIQLFILPLMLLYLSLCIKRLWMTSPSAFEKSMLMTSVCLPSCKFWVTSSMIFWTFLVNRSNYVAYESGHRGPNTRQLILIRFVLHWKRGVITLYFRTLFISWQTFKIYVSVNLMYDTTDARNS